jgi:hypothetical protein
LKNICGASRLSAQVFDNLLEFNIRKYQAQYATKDLAPGNASSAIQISGVNATKNKNSSIEETNDGDDDDGDDGGDDDGDDGDDGDDVEEKEEGDMGD